MKQIKNNKMFGGIPEYTEESLRGALTSFVNSYSNRPNRQLPDLRWLTDKLNVKNGDRLHVEITEANEEVFIPNPYTILIRVPISFEVSNPSNNRAVVPLRDKILMLKHYRETQLYGTRVDQYERFLRESKVLSVLSDYVGEDPKKLPLRLVPVLYHYGDRKDPTIYMLNIKGYNFNKAFDVLDADSKMVLKYILKNRSKNTQISNDTFKILPEFKGDVSEILKDLKDRSLISILNSDGTDFRVIPQLRASKRFTITKEGELLEKPSFIKHKKIVIETAVRNLFQIQRIANQQSQQLEHVLYKPDLETYISQDRSSLNCIFVANEQNGETFSRVFRNSHRLEDALLKINKPLIEDSGYLIQFTQGDANPANCIVRGKEVYWIDFDKSCHSFWGNDLIDFITYIGLFSGVKDTNNFYEYALSIKPTRDFMTPEQIASEKEYKDAIEGSFGRLFSLARIKRDLTTIGRLSEIVLKAGGVKEQSEIRKYEERRLKYLRGWWKLLEECEEGERLKDVLSIKDKIFCGTT